MRAYGARFHGGGSASGIRDQLISTLVYVLLRIVFGIAYGIATEESEIKQLFPLRIETSEKRPSLVGFSSMFLDVG
jgi:hypothetical protein